MKYEYGAVMKKRFSFCFNRLRLTIGLLLSVLYCVHVSAGLQNIDGTSSVQWQGSQVTFDTNHDYAQGFVKFADGIFVHRNINVTLDISESISGQINLDDLGKIILNGPLYLASDATLANGGIIEGRGHTITLDNDLTLTAGKQLHITSTLSIDGRGNTLYLEPHACLVVDHGVTLTLKNMRVKNTRNNSSNPIIRPTGPGARVALLNAELALADDFMFRNGQLFIHDDVLISGSHTFLYQSTQPSYICDGATFGFDHGSTFLYYPGSTNNSLINMQSKTASMYFDGASLQTTHTGLRLSKGALLLDNNVTLSSQTYARLASMTTDVNMQVEIGSTVNSAQWSPDGKYVAIGTSGTPRIGIYRFNEATLSLSGAFLSLSIDSRSCTSVAWSPDGRYVAFASGFAVRTGILYLYKREGENFTSVQTLTLAPDGVYVQTVSWSLDGAYLAVGTDVDPTYSDAGIAAGHEVQIFSFDGESLTGVTSVNQDADVTTVQWSPDGNYLAVGTEVGPVYSGGGITAGDELQLFSFNKTTGVLTGFAGIDEGVGVKSVRWSPDGTYLAVATQSTPTYTDSGITGGDELQVFRFDGTSLVGVGSYDQSSSSFYYTDILAWHSNGRYLSYGYNIYRFEGATITSVLSVLADRNRVVSWRPDGNFLACGRTYNESSPEFYVYQAHYVAETNEQAFSNGIIFGDSGAGSLYDLDVLVLGGAQAEIAGYVHYNNAS